MGDVRHGSSSEDGSGGGKQRGQFGVEQKLWQAADKLRGHMDAAEYKHVVLGLIFLKYIPDAFQKLHQKLAHELYANPEDRDEYTAENIFWVPKEGRRSFLQDHAKQSNIGKLVDDAMDAIEKANPGMKRRSPKRLSDEDIAHISRTTTLRAGKRMWGVQDALGFSKSAQTEEIATHGYILTPGRYVGAEAAAREDELFEEKMQRLVAKLGDQFAESDKLERRSGRT